MANKRKIKKKGFDSLIFWLVVLSILVILWTISGPVSKKPKPMIFSDFLNNVKSGNIEEVKIDEQEIIFKTKDNSDSYITYIPKNYDTELVKLLNTKNVKIKVNHYSVNRYSATIGKKVYTTIVTAMSATKNTSLGQTVVCLTVTSVAQKNKSEPDHCTVTAASATHHTKV